MLTQVSIHTLTRTKEAALTHYQQRVAELRPKARVAIVEALTETTGTFWNAQKDEPSPARVNSVLDMVSNGRPPVGQKYGPPVGRYATACNELLLVERELRRLRGMGSYGAVVWLDNAEVDRFLSQRGFEA